MKARLLLDQWADVTKLTDELRDKVVPVAVGKVIDWKIPEGTIFEGPQALCMEALDIPDARRHAIQLNYKMSSLGINDKGDRELYRAGVIEGYDGDLKYIPGKNWDAYMKAKAELKKTEDDI
jgi:hypothetical protein